MKLIVNGQEQETPCKKVKLDEHFTPNEIKKDKSLYLVVNAEMMSPNPKPKPAIIIINTGTNKI